MHSLRSALVKAGDDQPLDLRLSRGEVVRFLCAALPDGGRMLSYTYVSDIVTHSDDLEFLKAALNKVDEGIILLDQDLNAQFMNKAVRELWHVSDAQAELHPSYKDLVSDARQSSVYGVPPDRLEDFIARRIARVKVGDTTAQDMRVSDGRHFRSKCAVLPGGGRMLTYSDITDLVNNAAKLQELATTDFLTGLNNRRNFLELADSEWSRFNRYHRPLSLLMVDIDHFKVVNDKYGHGVGDVALAAVAKTCMEDKRASDVVGRIGGEEFVILLPETDAMQAEVVARRILEKVKSRPIQAESDSFNLSVSIGLAQATASMSGTGALLKAADQALYRAKAQGRNQVAQFTPIVPILKVAAE